MATGREAYRFHRAPATGQIISLAFAPDGRSLSAAASGGIVRFWDLTKGKDIQALPPEPAGITAIAYAPDGKTLTCALRDGQIRLWNVAIGKPLRRLRGHACQPTGLVFAKRGKLLVSWDYGGTIRVWRPETGDQLRHWRAWQNEDGFAALAPDGQTLATPEAPRLDSPPLLCLWDITTGKPLSRLGGPARFFETRSVAFSSDGKTLVSGDEEGVIRQWNVQTGKEIGPRLGYDAAVTVLVWAPDGKSLASAGACPIVPLWDARTARELRRLSGHQVALRGLAISPDGRHLAACGWRRVPRRKESDLTVQGAVWLWQLSNGKLMWQDHGGSPPERIGGVAFTPDSKYVLLGSRPALALQEVVTGRSRLRVPHTGGMASLALSPDGRTAATGDYTESGHFLRLWDLGSAIAEVYPRGPPPRLPRKPCLLARRRLAGPGLPR
jgi:WD40 repeat protein